MRSSFLFATLAAACATNAPIPSTPPSQAPRAAAARDEAWRATPPPPDVQRAFDYPVAQRTTFDNGLTVLFLERSTPLLTVQLVVRRGATSDPPGKKGLMALTSRMLVEATNEKDSLALAEAAESLGGQLEAYTGYDHTSVELEFLSDDMDRGFGLLAEVVTAPRFDASVFQRVRSEWLDGLRAERQEPDGLANLAGMRALLGDDLGAPTDGSLTDVAKLGTADLRTTHARLYDPALSALVVVGGAPFGKVVDAARKAFSSWQKRPAGKLREIRPAPANAPKALIVDRPGAVQSAVFAGLALPPRETEGFERRELLNQVLGGMFTSRLNQNLREKHAFTYGAFSQNYATEHFGVWELNTSVRAEDTGPALREILRELEALRTTNPVTQSELERGKRELLGGYVAHLERSSSVNDDLSEIFADRLELGYLSQLGSVVGNIGVAAVQKEAALRMDPAALTIVVVGDAKRIRTQVEAALTKVSLAPSALVD